jgi:hypothetical protein
MIFGSFILQVVKSFWWKNKSLPPAKSSMMGEVSSNCQRGKARAQGTSVADSSANQTPESACRVHRFSAIGSHFSFQFDDAKVPPNLLLLHSPSLRLTIHTPSHSERAERVSRLPLMCPVLARVTMP